MADGWLASNEHIKAGWRSVKLQAARQVALGSEAINDSLYSLEYKLEVKLFDFMKHNRPLVVNFGSCT